MQFPYIITYHLQSDKCKHTDCTWLFGQTRFVSLKIKICYLKIKKIFSTIQSKNIVYEIYKMSSRNILLHSANKNMISDILVESNQVLFSNSSPLWVKTKVKTQNNPSCCFCICVNIVPVKGIELKKMV